ncbi:MAG: large conductance mechanosensitive channel protein MscL [Candidatus Eisenbacteria bacterium]|uniref:Large-conductance mechanosensitive channel n=1 Tax=Eiseniibacteriota bacterium TaxID=2212470 RepID=A0A7Y2EAJ5_UNCEI|nr:large conductance mechanosensitive channel protein MscL [Candidatus Eisenbacteria bacterium]
MLSEFKAFAMRGNVLDMAVGIILGAAFGKVVTTFVKDVMMPPIGKAMGGVDFGQMYYNLSETSYESLAAAQEAGAPVVLYGAWINTIIDFIIVAFILFLIIRQMNKMKKKEEAAPAAPPKNEVLLEEIRDLLKK